MWKKPYRNDNSHTEYKLNSIRNKHLGKPSINLESESDSEKEHSKAISPRKAKLNKRKNNEKEKNIELLGNKHVTYLAQDVPYSRNNQAEIKKKKIKNLNESSIKTSKKIVKPSISGESNSLQEERRRERNNLYKKKEKEKEKEVEDGDEMVIFPYEFTERIIDALSCKFCGGIYIRPYVINVNGCGHIFCLGCIMKMLENNSYGECKVCKAQFNENYIKYSEVTDFYVAKFFPEIPKIIEENKKLLNEFMESEAKKYNKLYSGEEEVKLTLKCQLKPFKENIPVEKRLPEIVKQHNNFIISVKSDDENIVSIIKKQVIKRINMRHLKEEDIEIRWQGLEISQFTTFRSIKEYIPMNSSSTIIFFYNKKV